MRRYAVRALVPETCITTNVNSMLGSKVIVTAMFETLARGTGGAIGLL